MDNGNAQNVEKLHCWWWQIFLTAHKFYKHQIFIILLFTEHISAPQREILIKDPVKQF